jgi:tetratricopeptide (TPR) repeat protein
VIIMKPLTRLTAAAIALAVGLALATSGCSRDPEARKRDFMMRGDRYMSENNFSAAILEYRNALQQDARYVDGYRKLALAFIRAGEIDSAFRATMTAANIATDDLDLQTEAGALLLYASKFEEAKATAQRILAISPHDVRGHILLGNATAGLNDVDTAVAQFEEAIRLDPHRPASYTTLGQLKAIRGETAAAERAFRQAIAEAPKSVAARLALAQFCWSTGRTEEAEQILKEAVTLAPRDQGANVALAAFYRSNGRGPEAERYLKSALDAGADAGVTLILADSYIEVGRLDEAAVLLNRVSLDRKVGSRAQVRLAAIARSRGNPADAMRLIDAVLASDSRNSFALVARADLLLDGRRLDDALQAADAAVAADPSSASAQMVRGRVLVAIGRADKAQRAFEEVLRLNPHATAAQIELARLHLGAGATDQSVSLATRAARTPAGGAEAGLVLARGLMVRHEYAKAQSVLQDALRAAPGDAAAHGQMGLLLAMQQETGGARREFVRALEIDPLQLDAIAGLTALDFSSDRRAEAMSRLDGVLARAPANAGLLLIAARAAATINDLARAEALLVRAVEADPGSLPAYSALGRVYLAQNRLDAARVQFEKVAAGAERPVGVLTLIGIIDQIQNRTAEARQTFERVLAIDPHAGVAANNLAWLYAETGGNLDLALKYAETAVSALPEESEGHDTLGWVYYKRGAAPPAIKALQRSLELNPRNAAAAYHLAIVYDQSGDRVNARQTFELYLKLDPTSEHAADVRRRLQSGTK